MREEQSGILALAAQTEKAVIAFMYVVRVCITIRYKLKQTENQCCSESNYGVESNTRPVVLQCNAHSDYIQADEIVFKHTKVKLSMLRIERFQLIYVRNSSPEYTLENILLEMCLKKLTQVFQILQVHAEDGDKGSPREVRYGLVSEGNPFTSFFDINDTSACPKAPAYKKFGKPARQSWTGLGSRIICSKSKIVSYRFMFIALKYRLFFCHEISIFTIYPKNYDIEYRIWLPQTAMNDELFTCSYYPIPARIKTT
ncbi:hypothetical protein GQX74_000133 [Glossina fuscipes]|nr:hypothetical protein GQX74_000133 [Glossina fuscipes]